MSEKELNDYFEALSKERSYFIQKWFETQAKSELDEYISHLTKEEKDALFILLIIKFMNLFDEKKRWRRMRLIDADALKKSIKSYADDQYAENEYLGEYAIMDIIDNAPTVEEKEEPQGEWIIHNDYHENCRYGCNQCGNLTNIPGNFCPNCGVKMRRIKKND